jgi:hypothetical protein
MTADEADEALARYGPDDLAYALELAEKHGASPVWRAALDRARAREGGGAPKTRDHRRGRRG